MMGGHGFSSYSKMGALYSNNDVNNTWEGENNVLIQQTTKYVLENFQRAMQGKVVKSPLLAFLANVHVLPFSLAKTPPMRSIGNFCLISTRFANTWKER